MLTFLRKASPWLLLAVLTALMLRRPDTFSDSIDVVRGSLALRKCVAAGSWSSCPGVSYFPAYQYLPSLLAGALGMGEDAILRVLILINFGSVLGLMALLWRDFRKSAPELFLLGALAFVASPFLYYAKGTFGEPLAALLIVLFLRAARGGASAPALVALAFAAGLTKETAFVFLILLGGACCWDRPGRGRKLAAIVAGSLLSYGAAVAFNELRYGLPYNTVYLSPRNIVPSLSIQLAQAVAIWLSPNGGVLLFLPVCAAVIFLWLGERSGEGRVPKGAALLALLGLTLGFAKWYSPFGWEAWGPRLMLPWIPPLLWMAFWFGERPIRHALRAWAGSARAYAVSLAALIVVALPHAWMLINSFPIRQKLFVPTEACPRALSPDDGLDYFYACSHVSYWPAHPAWSYLFAKAADYRYALLGLLYAGVLLEICLELKKKAGRKPGPPSLGN